MPRGYYLALLVAWVLLTFLCWIVLRFAWG
jgi:hypothetical protein